MRLEEEDVFTSADAGPPGIEVVAAHMSKLLPGERFDTTYQQRRPFPRVWAETASP